MRGKVEIGPFGGKSKSARRHQAFLVTAEGERLLLRRFDGPAMRDQVLEALAGALVEAEGLLREQLFIAKALRPISASPARASETAPSSGRKTPKQRR